MVKTVVDIKGMTNDRETSATAAPYLSILRAATRLYALTFARRKRR